MRFSDNTLACLLGHCDCVCVCVLCMHAHDACMCIIYNQNPLSLRIRNEHGFPECRCDHVYCPKNLIIAPKTTLLWDPAECVMQCACLWVHVHVCVSMCGMCSCHILKIAVSHGVKVFWICPSHLVTR